MFLRAVSAWQWRRAQSKSQRNRARESGRLARSIRVASSANQISRGTRRSMPHQIAPRSGLVTTLFVERLPKSSGDSTGTSSGAPRRRAPQSQPDLPTMNGYSRCAKSVGGVVTAAEDLSGIATSKGLAQRPTLVDGTGALISGPKAVIEL